MVVKNEGKNIRQVLTAALPFIDSWTILVDAASTDDTEAICLEVLGNTDGRVIREPWHGFKESRNLALALHADQRGAAEFTLMLSGDEFLRDGDKLRAYLETQRLTEIDCHFVRLALDDGVEWQPRILRTGSKWRYDDFDLGMHEVPVYPDGEAGGKVQATASGHIEHVVSDPIGRVDNILDNHVPLLRAALERNPDNARALEFLAQSLEQNFRTDLTEEEREGFAVECQLLYARRLALPFTSEEHKRFFVMRFIDISRLGKLVAPDELFEMADALCQADPTRPEPFLARAVIFSGLPGAKASEVYQYARAAAEVAERIRTQGGLTNSSPLDMSTEWRAHRLAAGCAWGLATKHPEYKKLITEHVNAGIKAGGPWVMFKSIIESANAPKAAPETVV